MKSWFWMAALPAAFVMSAAHAADAMPAIDMVSVPVGCF
jgi:hypothetical protein